MPTARLILETPDGPMPAYAAGPDGSAKGGIVVIPDAWSRALVWFDADLAAA
jgi:dienelactone hydrolase